MSFHCGQHKITVWLTTYFIGYYLFGLVHPILCLSFPMQRIDPSQRRQLTVFPLYMNNPSNNNMQSSTQTSPIGNDNSIGLRRRWRRRRKDSIVIPINTDGSIDKTNNIKDEEDEIIDDSDSSTLQDVLTRDVLESTKPTQCPLFSMTFPRYRINLSSSIKQSESEQRRIRRVERGIITKLVKPNTNNSDERRRLGKENNNPLDNIMSGLFKGVTNALPKNDLNRKALESLYSGGDNNFRWVSSSPTDEDVDVDLHAAAAFWRMASDITSNCTAPELSYLALPETTHSVAQNLCDILNWYAEYSQGVEDRGKMILNAEVDLQSDAVPVVRFSARNNNKTQQKEDEFVRERNLLPTATETERRTKAWVKRLLVKLGICPFTKSDSKSGQGLRDLGVPVANIMYRHSAALSEASNDVYLLMADIWGAISDMIAARPTGISSILLSAPGYDDNFELWAGPIFAMLETCVGSVQAEEMIGVVCFHPQCKFICQIIVLACIVTYQSSDFIYFDPFDIRCHSRWKVLAWLWSYAFSPTVEKVV